MFWVCEQKNTSMDTRFDFKYIQEYKPLKRIVLKLIYISELNWKMI